MGDAMQQMYIEFRRLNGYPPIPTAPIDQMIDEASGMNDKIMKEFAEFFVHEILVRAMER